MELGETADCLDLRIHAFRHEIADIALADKIALPHYVESAMRTVGTAIADLRVDPTDTAKLSSQILFGEDFALLDFEDGWAWRYGLHDHFVGFVRQEALAPAMEATHAVAVPKVSVSGASDGASPSNLFMGSRVAGRAEDAVLVTAGGSIPIADVPCH